MNDRNKYKATEQMNHKKNYPKANVSVFLFFPNTSSLKTNAEHSRAPLKEKLNKRVILAYHKRVIFCFCQEIQSLAYNKSQKNNFFPAFNDKLRYS